jgi:glycosyltransferase involved in cell wall biosynthesis
MRDDDSPEVLLTRLLGGCLDPDWYQARYPDIAASNVDPHHHFIRYGAAEKRDPNQFFDSAWYLEHYPDVAASGFNPLLHYLHAGAAELRNPHPRFDAAYYVDQHPQAAANPLLYHLQIGMALGHLTEKPLDIPDYLPSERPALPLARGVFADVVILVRRGDPEATRRCIRSVLADRSFPLARIIVVDDHSSEPELSAWLQVMATEGFIHLIRNERQIGFAASANLGMTVAEGHDVVLLDGETEVPGGWLRRLTAHAYSQPNTATVSPLSDYAAIFACPDNGAAPIGESPEQIDEVCRTINRGRSSEVPLNTNHCIYIRRAALQAIGAFDAEHLATDDLAANDLCARGSTAGWHHRIAYDIFVASNRQRSMGLQGEREHAASAAVVPFQFAVTAALFRNSKLPVILMISHSLGGGVGRHIDRLIERYRDSARVLLLEGTDRGAALSVAWAPHHPVLTLSADRLDDLVTVLRSTGLSRIHIHHLLQMDIDVRALIHRLGVPFDVTVHDYYAICPQINLLAWSEGIYCNEPGPAACNPCIADRPSHGARDIASWRHDHAWQFMEADRVICPSADTMARLDRHGLGARAIVVPHERQPDLVWITHLPRSTAPPLRIVLLGVLANHKGARAVADLAEAVAPATIEIHLIGHLEDNFPKPAAQLIKVTGKYQDHDLPDLLQQIDPHVIWFPSSWPETYSYTLSAAIDSGLPIVATDIGAFSERLAGRPLTWLVDHRASTQDWLAAFDTVRTTLHDRVIPPPAVRKQTISDFYADRYLSPPRLTPIRAARRPRIAIVPERYGSGEMTPCAYIRLLQPLDHPAVRSDYEIILADAETIFDYDADIIARSAVPSPTWTRRTG